jgi:hypothetical protein
MTWRPGRHVLPLAGAGVNVSGGPAQYADRRHAPGTAQRPTDNFDGEPPHAQNTLICTGTWLLDLDSKAARNGYVRLNMDISHAR